MSGRSDRMMIEGTFVSRRKFASEVTRVSRVGRGGRYVKIRGRYIWTGFPAMHTQPPEDRSATLTKKMAPNGI